MAALVFCPTKMHFSNFLTKTTLISCSITFFRASGAEGPAGKKWGSGPASASWKNSSPARCVCAHCYGAATYYNDYNTFPGGLTYFGFYVHFKSKYIRKSTVTLKNLMATQTIKLWLKPLALVSLVQRSCSFFINVMFSDFKIFLWMITGSFLLYRVPAWFWDLCRDKFQYYWQPCSQFWMAAIWPQATYPRRRSANRTCRMQNWHQSGIGWTVQNPRWFTAC